MAKPHFLEKRWRKMHPRTDACLVALPSIAGGAFAQTPEIVRDADLALGEQLLRDKRCAECHARKVGGDGSAIYGPAGKINTPAALRSMVDYCSTELNLSLFPEEVTAMAAVLQRDHYHFGMGAAPATQGAARR